MLASTLRRLALGTVVLWAGAATAAPTLDAPATAKIGSEVTFTVAGGAKFQVTWTTATVGF